LVRGLHPRLLKLLPCGERAAVPVGLAVVEARGLAQGEALRFMRKGVGESQNYVLRRPARSLDLSNSAALKMVNTELSFT
jgi:hypothetical protein